LGASPCIPASSLLQPRLRDIPDWTKQAATPTGPAEGRNKEGTDSSRCAKKRCKVCQWGKGEVFSTLQRPLHDGNSEVSCGLIPNGLSFLSPSVRYRTIFKHNKDPNTLPLLRTPCLLASFAPNYPVNGNEQEKRPRASLRNTCAHPGSTRKKTTPQIPTIFYAVSP